MGKVSKYKKALRKDMACYENFLRFLRKTRPVLSGKTLKYYCSDKGKFVRVANAISEKEARALNPQPPYSTERGWPIGLRNYGVYAYNPECRHCRGYGHLNEHAYNENGELYYGPTCTVCNGAGWRSDVVLYRLLPHALMENRNEKRRR